MDENLVEIISFYEFKDLGAPDDLSLLKDSLKAAMIEHSVRGTIIIANEGFNGMVCGQRVAVSAFVAHIEGLLKTQLVIKSSFAGKPPFRKTDVRIKPEIVTLRQDVDISLGIDTHVPPSEWDRLISDPDTLVLDTRNDYEYRTGTFAGAINPGIAKFSDLPGYVAANLDPAIHKRVAMFCTGGIRCEKFTPYMKQLGFPEVYQLEGGILRYLEETEGALWKGECFVFDERVTVDASLRQGITPDLSQRRADKQKGRE